MSPIMVTRPKSTNQVGTFSGPASDPLTRKPTTGMLGCCARAASGHAAAPPSKRNELAASKESCHLDLSGRKGYLPTIAQSYREWP